MKKLSILFFSIMLMGCSSMLVNPNINYSEETVNGITVRKVTDTLSLGESFQASVFVEGSTLAATGVVMRTVYDINNKAIAMFFDNFGERSSSKMLYKTDDLYLRNVLFSNKELAVDMEIIHPSRLDTSSETIYELNRKEVKDLIKILESNKPVFIRITTNSRQFVLNFENKQDTLNLLKVADFLMN